MTGHICSFSFKPTSAAPKDLEGTLLLVTPDVFGVKCDATAFIRTLSLAVLAESFFMLLEELKGHYLVTSLIAALDLKLAKRCLEETVGGLQHKYAAIWALGLPRAPVVDAGPAEVGLALCTFDRVFQDLRADETEQISNHFFSEAVLIVPHLD